MPDETKIVTDALTTTTEAYTSLQAMVARLNAVVEQSFQYTGSSALEFRKAAIKAQRAIQSAILDLGALGGALRGLGE